MNKIFFTSDQHFGHRNIIKHCNRQFESVEEMDEILIQEWNKVVTSNTMEVFHLGDFSISDDVDYVGRILGRLNGNIVHIVGNHDRSVVVAEHFNKGNSYPLKNNRRGRAIDRLKIKRYGQQIILDHYRIFSWEGIRRGYWHIHGHHHNNIPCYGKVQDVGVDAIAALGLGYRPIEFQELKDILDQRPIFDPEQRLFKELNPDEGEK